MATIKGQRALGKFLGVTAKTANKYVNDPQWKKSGLSKKGPWGDKALIKGKAFVKRHYPRTDDKEPEKSTDIGGCESIDELSDLSPERRAKLQVLIETIATKKLNRELKLALYERKEEVEQQRLMRVKAVRSELSKIRLLAIKLVGSDFKATEQILEDWAKSVCDKFEHGQD